MQVNRRLYRCRHDRRLAGVAGGLAEYFDADPTLVRILWVLSIFLGGTGILLYLAMAIIVPLEPETGYAPGGAPIGSETGLGEAETGGTVAGSWTTPAAGSGHLHRPRGTGNGMTIAGIVLILFGSLALADTVLPDWLDHGRFLWPAFIVGIGILLVVGAIRNRPTEA
jgi:phage shock protein C